MGKVQTTVAINDATSPAFKSMASAMNIVINHFETLQKASGKAIDTKSIQAARGYLSQAETQFDMIDNQINKSKNSQESFNNSIQKGVSHSGSLVRALMGLSVVQKVVGMVSNSIDSAISRMDTMNNYPKVMSNLGINNEQSEASIQILSDGLKGLPTALNDAASAVQRFTASNNSIGYSTKMFLALNNAILAGGQSTDIQKTALEQISQAYSKGKPDMMEWKALQAAMPAQLQQIAKAMNKTEAQLGEGLRNGKISMSDFMDMVIQLNEKGANGFQSFAEQAKNATGGFATSIANMKTSVIRGVTNMMNSINKSLEKAGLPNMQKMITNFGITMENMLGSISNYASVAISVLVQIFQFVQSIGGFIVDNWSLIAPIVGGIVTTLLMYKGVLIGMNIAEGISAGLKTASAFASSVHAASLKMEAGATFTATAAQYGFNAALLACPLTWIVIAIIAVIAVIYLAVAAFNKLTDSAVSGTGIVVATISLAGAIIYNTFLSILEIGLTIINYLQNAFCTFVNFLANIFIDPIATIIHQFGSLADAVLGILEGIANAIDTIFGSNLGSAVSKWRDGLSSKIESAAARFGNGNYKKVAEATQLSLESLGLSRIDYKDSVFAGYNKGASMGNKVSDFFNFDKAFGKNNPATAALDYTSPALNNIADNTGKTAGSGNDTAANTKDIANTLDTTKEDLKYLRDLAEQEVINRFTTAEIKIDMKNNNNINSEMDLDGIVNMLGNKLQDAMEVAAEGTHY